MRLFMRLASGLLGLSMVLTMPALADDISNWSATDSSNNRAAPNGWQSGVMLPSQVEPTARAMMGAIKRFYDGVFTATTNTNLSALSTANHAAGVWRLGVNSFGDAPPLFFTPGSGACSLNSGSGDGGSQVPSSDSKCWLAAFPKGEADVREWGVKGDGATDNTTALQAAVNFGTGYATGITLLVPPGTFLNNTVTVRGFNLHIRGAGQDKTVFKPFTSGTVPWQIGSSSDPNPWLGTFTWSTGGIVFRDMTFDGTGKNTLLIKLDPSTQQTKFSHIALVGDDASTSLVFDQSDEPDYDYITGFCTTNTSFLIDWDTWGHNQHMGNGLLQGGSGGEGSGCSGVRITQGSYSSLSTSISGIVRSGTTATATTVTAIPSGMYIGATVVVSVSGATQTAYNGIVTGTITGTHTFTYTVSGSPVTPATGTITAVLDPRAVLHRVEGATIDGHTTYIASGPYAVQIENSLGTTLIGDIWDQIPVNGQAVYTCCNADDVKLIGNYYGGAGTISNQIGIFVNTDTGAGTQVVGGTCYNTNFCIATGNVTGAGPAIPDLYVAGLHANYTITQMGYFDSVGKLVLMGNVDDGGQPPSTISSIPANGTFGTASTFQHSTVIACGNLMTANNPVPYDASATYKTCANVGPSGFWGN